MSTIFLLNVVELFFTLLSFAILARALLSWVIRDPYNPVAAALDRITEPILEPLRRVIPPIGGMMDITPIVALLILQFLQVLIRNLILGMY